jgi:hypothetical protein
MSNTFVLAKNPADFEKAKKEDPARFVDAIRLDTTEQLYGVNDAEIIVLPGAEDHPLASNHRVQRLMGQGRPPIAALEGQAIREGGEDQSSQRSVTADEESKEGAKDIMLGEVSPPAPPEAAPPENVSPSTNEK